jgi:acyl-CoA thioesterase I
MFKDNVMIMRKAWINDTQKLCTALLFFIALLISSGCSNNKETAKENTDSEASQENETAVKPLVNTKNIIFFGNSLTAGYGLDPSEAFPALIQKKIDSLNLPYKVINAGLSGETSAGGKSRIDWILGQQVDVFVLELGGNDGLRGIPVSETINNLQSIIHQVKTKYPDAKIIIAGMQVPPNMGRRYADEFRSVFRKLAENNKTLLIPFLLEGVGGVAELNQPDGIHPTAEGNKIVAKTVWSTLKDLL